MTDIPEDLGIRDTSDIIEDRNLTMMLDPRDWTDLEVFRLIQGVELYKDDWNKVSNVTLICQSHQLAVHEVCVALDHRL